MIGNLTKSARPRTPEEAKAAFSSTDYGVPIRPSILRTWKERCRFSAVSPAAAPPA